VSFPKYFGPEGPILENLGPHLTAQIDGRLLNRSPIDSLSIFSTLNHAQMVYARNPKCWISDIFPKLTGISPYNTWDGQRGAGCPLTPRHIITAQHFRPPDGTIIRFVGMNGEVVQRTMLYGQSAPGYGSGGLNWPDFAIYVLDSDLPEWVMPFKIPAENLDYFLPIESLSQSTVFVFGTDQQKRALLFELWERPEPAKFFNFKFPANLQKRAFWRNPVVGDSGSPYFIIFDGEPILLGVLTGAACTRLTNQRDTINQMIRSRDAASEISTGYEVQVKSVSNFKNLIG
jgi:hypothetical protein